MSAMHGHIDDIAALDARQFVIALRKLANSLSYGIDKSPFVGSGIEFAQSRPYEPGDSIRSIDWRVTARVGRFFVKEYETPKTVPCFLLIDTSASMTVSSIARSKYHTALYIAGGIALACLDRVSPVGMISVGDRALRTKPSLSHAKILEALLHLRTFRYDEGTTLGKRIAQLSPSLGQRSLIVVLSDLHDESALTALKRLSQLHDCVVLQLQDPCEQGMRGTGFFRGSEAETGREFVTHGRRRWLPPSDAARQLKSSGIDHLLIRTDQPFEHLLRHLFKSRGAVGRGAR